MVNIYTSACSIFVEESQSQWQIILVAKIYLLTVVYTVHCTGDRTQDLCDTETLVVTLVGSDRNIFINIHIYRPGHTFTDTHLCNKTLGQYKLAVLAIP